MGLIQTPHLDFLDVGTVVFPNHSFSHPLSSTDSLVLTLVRRLCFSCLLLNYPNEPLFLLLAVELSQMITNAPLCYEVTDISARPLNSNLYSSKCLLYLR